MATAVLVGDHELLKPLLEARCSLSERTGALPEVGLAVRQLRNSS